MGHNMNLYLQWCNDFNTGFIVRKDDLKLKGLPILVLSTQKHKNVTELTSGPSPDRSYVQSYSTYVMLHIFRLFTHFPFPFGLKKFRILTTFQVHMCLICRPVLNVLLLLSFLLSLTIQTQSP